MPEPLQTTKGQRIPPVNGGLQVNFCKNPSCCNFGTPASNTPQSRGKYVRAGNDRYKVTGSPPALKCLSCGEEIPIKSNVGIAEELDRLMMPLVPPPQQSCQTEGYPNNGVPHFSAKSILVTYKDQGRHSQIPLQGLQEDICGGRYVY
ncbi:hypothetical protein [Geomonas sp. Red32]|uniref:hypothetical protein n=1 Tax=Geomonas sp. Red32 TaxID=2912856 RepID=UPI00202CFD1F|nr:hypothetical protein [Geomonas sp. Red32]